MPIILIGIGLAVFFAFTNPMYNEISSLRAQVASYDEALGNSKALENERDVLTAKKNSIDQINLAKLQKLLPENIDNIRLILEIEQIALPYGMTLKDVRYSTDEKKDAGGSAPGRAEVVQASAPVSAQSLNKDYGVWDLEFSTEGTYNDFLNFIKDLESNLRIVDISSINFSSDSDTRGSSSGSSSRENYQYSFKIKTYWLKN